MSRVYLHSNNHENSLNKLMICLFIPFIMYGFYKNGIKLYIDNYINLLEMFMPIIMVGISILTTYIFSKISKEKLLGYRLISNLLISMIAMPNINIFVYIILLLILNLVTKYIKMNIVPIFMIVSIIINMILRNYNFFNSFEVSVEHSYSLFDYILGKGYGGVSNTLLIMSLISLIILVINLNYKKQIPIMAFSTYYILAIITSFISVSLDQNLLLNNNVVFSFIFLSNISIYTPYSKGGCYIYGLLLGLLTYAFYFIDVNLGVYIVIAILSFVSQLLDLLIVGKNDKHLVEVL